MKVHQVMSRSIVCVSPSTSFKELWKIIFQKKVNSIPVVDAKRKLLGIISKEDLLRQLYPDFGEFISDFESASDFEAMEQKVKELVGLTAKDIMGKRIIFTRHDTFVMRALSRMIARSVNQLPVLDQGDRLVGMITKGDIFYALFRGQLSGDSPGMKSRKKKTS